MQQQIVFQFGAAHLREILDDPAPFVFPIVDYAQSMDVYIFILY